MTFDNGSTSNGRVPETPSQEPHELPAMSQVDKSMDSLLLGMLWDGDINDTDAKIGSRALLQEET